MAKNYHSCGKVINMKLLGKKKHPKHDVWITEIDLKDEKISDHLKKLLKLVAKYEELHRAD